MGFLERGQQPPPHQLGGLGSIVNSPSGVRGGAAAAQRFFPIFSALKMAFPDTIKLLIADCHAAIGGKTPCPLAYAPALHAAVGESVWSVPWESLKKLPMMRVDVWLIRRPAKRRRRRFVNGTSTAQPYAAAE